MVQDDLTELLSGPRDFDSSQAEQNFKIAGSDFFAEMLMPRLASLLHQVAPGIQIQLVDLVAGNHIATLEKHEVDMALIPQEALPDWVDSTPIFRSPFVVIARDGHEALRQAGLQPYDTIPIDLFCELRHAVFSPEGKLKAMGDAVLSRIGRERRVVMTMPTFGGICHAVSESDLVALLPEPLALRMAPRLQLAVFHAPMQMEPPQICMTWHKRNTGSTAHRWLREIVVQVLAPLDYRWIKGDGLKGG